MVVVVAAVVADVGIAEFVATVAGVVVVVVAAVAVAVVAVIFAFVRVSVAIPFHVEHGAV